jgi:signal transduction histidine kinase
MHDERILVVDDNEATRYAVARVLKLAGFAVLEAGTGAEAIAVAQKELPALITLDIKLPDILGFEVAERLRGHPATSAIAILHLSASYTSPDAQAKGLLNGADGYLVHPVDKEVLTATVRALLRMRSAEQARQELVVKLEEALVLRDEFLSIASHDLRNPLAALQLKLEKLVRDHNAGADAATLKRAAESSLRTLKSTVTLLDTLLDVSQAGSSSLSVTLVPTELRRVVAAVIERMEGSAVQAGSSLTLLDGEPVPGTLDPTRVDQIVGNLISNAIKYGNGQPIEVSVWEEGGRARIAVRDCGPGIALEDQDRIFRRFERGALRDQSHGVGVGLWIVHRLIEALGGQLLLKSAPGKGATFLVELPLAPAAAAA